MAKVWTADELADLSPEQDQARFEAGLVRDLSKVPSEYLDRQRARLDETLQRRRRAAGAA